MNTPEIPHIITISRDVQGGNEYALWLSNLKQRYRSHQIKAAMSVNREILEFYWELGADLNILLAQTAEPSAWAFYNKVSRDLQRELPDIKGLSPRNLSYIRQFYDLYATLFVAETNIICTDAKRLIINLQQLAANSHFSILLDIPWSHHIQILTKCSKEPKKALYFVQKTLENNWSRAVLQNFIATDLYERQGKAITNFATSLPQPQGELAQQLTKDPYCFDFLTLTETYTEKELESALIDNVTRFLLELGAGFSYMGRQVRLVVDGQEFFLDLLFYHAKLHAYVVVELKSISFAPEHLGQIGFYVSAVNHLFKTEHDNPTIGLLICKDKSNVVAKYALETVQEPIGISEFQLSKLYPTDFKSSLPSIEDIEKELS